MVARCAVTSASVIPSGTPMAAPRASRGIAVRSSSTLLTPIAASIAARSASVCGEYGLLDTLVGLIADMRGVRARVEERRGLGLIGHPHLHEPAILIRRPVHQLGALDDLHVALDDLARYGRIDVRCCFHRLDDAEARVLPHGRALLGQLDEHDVAQLILREVRDADRGNVALGPHPLMLLRVAKVVGDVAHVVLLLSPAPALTSSAPAAGGPAARSGKALPRLVIEFSCRTASSLR